MPWSIHGEYLESCDRAARCPCNTSSPLARPERPVGAGRSDADDMGIARFDHTGLNGNHRAFDRAA